MDKQGLFNYIMASPHNTNPNVLSTLINTNNSNENENGDNVIIVIPTLGGTQENPTISFDKTYEEIAAADLALLQINGNYGGSYLYTNFILNEESEELTAYWDNAIIIINKNNEISINPTAGTSA